MRKDLSSLFTGWFAAIAVTTMLFCGISCASTGSSPKEAEVDFDTNALLGTWFWNFGYDQASTGK